MKSTKVTHSIAAFGYDCILGADGSVLLVSNEEEARIVALAFRFAVEEKRGPRAIAERLNARGGRKSLRPDPMRDGGVPKHTVMLPKKPRRSRGDPL